MLPKKYIITSTNDIEETIEGIRARSRQFTHVNATPSHDWAYDFRQLTLGSVRLGTSTVKHISYMQNVFDDVLIGGVFAGTDVMKRGSLTRSASSLASFAPLSSFTGEVSDAEIWTVRLKTETFYSYMQAHDVDIDLAAWIDCNWLKPNTVSSAFNHFVNYTFALLNDTAIDPKNMNRSLEDLFYSNAVCLMQASMSGSIVRQGSKLFARVVDFVEGNLYNNITLLDISNNVGASIRSVQYAVRNEAEMTVTRFVMERRLMRARRLLQAPKSGATVRSISDALGFDSPSYFGKLYVRRFGETPGQTLARN